MTGSLYSAIAGLKTHMGALSVIGNNVSNVNTLGYKATRYTFNEALYSNARSGSDGSSVQGGRNPGQVGYGANMGTIDLDMSSKNYTPTGRALDTMIDGDGFFVVGDKVTPEGMYGLSATDGAKLKKMDLSRLGNFTIDPNGYLVDGNGSVVWGFAETEITMEDMIVNGENVPGLNTLNAAIRAAREDTSGATPYPDLSQYNNITYDAEGVYIKQATMTSNIMTAIRLPKMDERVVFDDGSVISASNTEALDSATGRELGKVTVAFPREVSATGENISNNGNDAVKAAQIMDADDAKNFWDSYAGTGGAAANPKGATNYPRLQPDTVSINDKTGALTVMTDDEQLVVVGYLAIAKVTNPDGVSHVNGRYYQAQEGAGKIRITTVGGAFEDEEAGITNGGDTRLQTGGLESSGTDLATEITNMITVQRGYQANTRIVTVTDSMLEELVNMKR